MKQGMGHKGVLDGWLVGIDPVAAVRGMSSGFSVLVIGSLLVPVVASQLPVVGSFGLTLAAIVAFIVAATRQGDATVPASQGATAALGAYLLVLPLVYMTTHRWDLMQIGLTVLAALVVGAITGSVAARVAARVARTGANA